MALLETQGTPRLTHPRVPVAVAVAVAVALSGAAQVHFPVSAVPAVVAA